MQIKNVTEYNMKILNEWLYLKSLYEWSDPEKRANFKLVVAHRNTGAMELQLTSIEARTILSARMRELEEKIETL